MKVLFVCKNRVNTYGNSFGLYNSARLVAETLEKHGVEAKVVTVIDNNCIDREVTLYDPTHVVIEALWVVPEKFPVLLKLHPNRKWIVRIHSKIPFLSMEGIAITWLRAYGEISKKNPNFTIAANNSEAAQDIENTLGIPCLYQPNIYSLPDVEWSKYIRRGFRNPEQDYINIGCFGAIRPFKNQLVQAFAAVQFANSIGKRLYFHVNSGRTEQRGEEVLKNIRATFPIGGHQLVEHEWLNYEDFLGLVSTMDLGMQVSMTESFNIVAANFVQCNVPVIVSPDISWVNWIYQAEPHSTAAIAKTLQRAWSYRRYSLQSINMWNLLKYNNSALDVWLESF